MNIMNYPNLTLGVLGGMGPMATAEFLRVLATRTPASCDQEHPRLILYSNPSIPDRTEYIEGKGESPIPFLLEGINYLTQWGADILAVPCNTSHYFLDCMVDDIKLPIVSIVDETINKAKTISPVGAWLLATNGTRKTNVYERHASCADYTFFYPSMMQQDVVSNVIALVKSGKIEESSSLLGNLCSELWGQNDVPIIAACTELPIAYSSALLPESMMISSIEALADGCIKRIYNK